jgi:hypothetical protein
MGLDAAPFLAALALRHGTGDVARGRLADTLGAFHSGLAKLVAFVDALPVQRAE